MSTAKGNAVVGQSGGPTSVINQSLVGVIQEARKHGHIGKLLGAEHGVSGIVANEFIDLNDVSDDLLERIAQTPAAALGSTRVKPNAEYCGRIFESFRKHDVRYFFYIGGNDSADTARIVQELAAASKYELRVFHIPKTIDNDLRVHDHTPGFGSAARFVAAAMAGDNFDNASLPGVKIDVIMGRHAGFLTAASVLARRHPEDGPHLIYVPEAPFGEDKFLSDVDAVYKKHGRCLIAVSEGASQPGGKTWAEALKGGNLDKDAHGNVQLAGSGALGDALAALITQKIQLPGGKKLRVRADTFGYLQRSFPGLAVSEVDAAEARAVGAKAVQISATPGVAECSVYIKRLSDSPYKMELDTTSIKNVARETKHLDASFIENGNDITQAFIDYARPLVGSLPAVGSFEELNR
jgi:6-phosphofructokinase 1